MEWDRGVAGVEGGLWSAQSMGRGLDHERRERARRTRKMVRFVHEMEMGDIVIYPSNGIFPSFTNLPVLEAFDS